MSPPCPSRHYHFINCALQAFDFVDLLTFSLTLKPGYYKNHVDFFMDGAFRRSYLPFAPLSFLLPQMTCLRLKTYGLCSSGVQILKS